MMVAVINSIESPICCIDCPKCCLKDETFNPLHPLKLVTLQLDLIPPVNMRTEALEKRLLKIICIILAMIGPWKAFSAPQLPEPEFSWKNVAVDGKKTAVFCIFRDSRGIMWLGTNSGLYFYDGITTHPVGETEIFGTQVYSIVEKDNRLFIGSNNGLLTYDYASGQVIESDIDSPKEIRSLLLIDDDIWVGGLNGIYKFNLN
ncbi:two-component regulator propeller domain-containing protein, partial [Bacteroides acidifaciens]